MRVSREMITAFSLFINNDIMSRNFYPIPLSAHQMHINKSTCSLHDDVFLSYACKAYFLQRVRIAHNTDRCNS